jgi:hypothetical protein
VGAAQIDNNNPVSVSATTTRGARREVRRLIGEPRPFRLESSLWFYCDCGL